MREKGFENSLSIGLHAQSERERRVGHQDTEVMQLPAVEIIVWERTIADRSLSEHTTIMESVWAETQSSPRAHQLAKSPDSP